MSEETKEAMKDLLTQAGATFKGDTACTCPFHRDRNPSAGIYLSESGVWRFKCQVCEDNLDAIGFEAKITGRSPEDIIRGNKGDRVEPTVTYTEDQIRTMFSAQRGFKFLHEYQNTKNEITHFVACKYEGEHKKFTQISRFGFNFILKNNSALNPLFRLNKIKDKDLVVIVEGEKCVIALEHIGIDYVTTTMGGAKNAKKADLSPLAGKRVIIFPDNDKAGKDYMDDLISILTQMDCLIGTIDPNELMLGEKEDVADYIKKYIGQYTKEELKKDLEETFSLAKTNGYFDTFEKEKRQEIETGEMKSLDIGWDCLGDCKWMIGGTVTTLCAKPGVGKTWFVHNLTYRASERGIKVANIQLEDDLNYHVSRILYSMTGITNDPDEITSDDIKRIKDHQELINQLGKCIVVPEFEKCSLQDVADLVKEKARLGCKIIIVDSVSVAEKSPKNSWVDDQIFVNKIKFVTNVYKCRVVLVTHPKQTASSTNKDGKQVTTMSMDTMSGGTAYQRLSQTILWLHDVPIGTSTIGYENEGNRGITILKARNKTKHTPTNRILFRFEKARFNELGYF